MVTPQRSEDQPRKAAELQVDCATAGMDEPVTLTYELDGHLAQTITLVPVDGLEVPEVRLRRRRRAAPTETGGGTLPIKTGM